jgi:hypothetical protein
MNTGFRRSILNMEFKAMPRYQEATADPNKMELEVLEYWNETNHYVLLNRKLVIINEENSFNEICYRSCCFTDVLDSSLASAWRVCSRASSDFSKESSTDVWTILASGFLVLHPVRGRTLPPNN